MASHHTGRGELLGVGLFEKLDGASGGNEDGRTRALLVGELTLGKHLDMAELGHRDVAFGKDGLSVVESDASLARDAIGDTLLKFLAGVDIHLGHTVVLEDGDADVERSTGIVIIRDFKRGMRHPRRDA